MPTISTLSVNVVANTATFSKAMLGVTGAVVAVGAIAGKMALDFDTAFTRISAVSNASEKDIERWRGQVLELAGKTAQAPKELADALFFLASAGLKTSQIMPTLEAAAKGSAAGLGETADIAKLTANTLNAYAGSGLQASQVTDVLAAAVREGSADTDEFGTAIGRILPIASKAGIGFDQVAASLASLSNIGLDVNEGVTAMRGLMQALVAPGTQAAQAMKQVGLSSQELLTSLQEDGLVGTLRLLDEEIRKNTNTDAEYMNTLRMIVPNVRALTGALGLTEQQASRVDGVFQRVTHSSGDMNRIFDETRESAGFKLEQAFAKLQVVLIQIGDIILPAVASAATAFAKALDSLPPGAAEVIVKIGLMVAAVGPLIIIGGKLVAAFKLIVGAIRIVTLALSANPYVLLIAATVALIILIVKNWDKIKEFVLKTWNEIKASAIASWNQITGAVSGAVAAIVGAVTRFWQAVKDRVSDVVGFFKELPGNIARIFAGIGMWLFDAGRDLLVGFINGIKSMFGTIWSTLTGWASGLISDVKGIFGIGSPSKVFEDIGINLMAGLDRGVSRGSGPVMGKLAGISVPPISSNFVGAGGDIVLKVNGETLGRVTRDELVKLQRRNATTGVT